MSEPTSATPDPAVIVGREGAAGRLTLNRPAALNALTHEMIDVINSALDEFETDAAVTRVVIDAEGERAFCAGGDIRAIYDAAVDGTTEPRRFWADEYRLNARLHSYPKPIVAIMHGIVMGGGVGLSAHSSHRVATDSTVVAMPEVSIGFSPDVGATWLLTRNDDEIGTHVALTTDRLGAADAIAANLADCYVPEDRIADLVAASCDADVGVDAAIARFATEPPVGRLAGARHWIDECYAADSVPEILARLRGHGNDEARAAAERIEANSPTAVSVALEALRRARDLPSLEACLDMEFRISVTFFEGSEFREGIRAAVIDKDRNPQWDPATLEEVTPAAVAEFFAPQPDDIHLAE